MAARLAPAGRLTTREKLWTAMRELQQFTVPELARAAKVDSHAYNIMDYLQALWRAGILGKERVPHARTRYNLLRDMGVDAPRVRRDGSPTPESSLSRMWRAMKILNVFSVRDLMVHAALPAAPIAQNTASDYCQWLTRGGYLVKLPCAPGDVIRWRFIRDTGPKAPQVLRVRQLFDANTGEIVAGQDVQSALDESEASA